MARSATSTAFDVSSTPGAQIHWTNAAGGLWNNASNWDLHRVPITGDTVLADGGMLLL